MLLVWKAVVEGALPKTQVKDFDLACTVCIALGNPSKINVLSKGEIMGFSSSLASRCPRRFYHFSLGNWRGGA